MKIAFFSNFLNHHQLPFSQAMVKLTNDQYTFVATEPVPDDRLSMGYYSMNDQYPFVLKTYESENNRRTAFKLADECDVVIIGSAPSEYVDKRIKNGKLTFHYSERLYKNGYFYLYFAKKVIPLFYARFRMKNNQGWLWDIHGQYRDCQNLYMLCSSQYTAGDLWLSKLYRGKTYKWGYFPEVKQQNIKELLRKKDRNVVQIMWAGRMLSWKHPEECVFLADKLKKHGYSFHINVVGNGNQFEKLQQLIMDKKLSDEVSLLGFMSPGKVRENMEQSDIFIFTSDYNEGWGAVLNEAMNSGCAVVSSDAIGSTGFLIHDGVNGFKYRNASHQDLYRKVSFLIEHPEKRKLFAENAYKNLIEEWNAEEAAKRLIDLSERLNCGKSTPYQTGPCSIAKPVFKGRLIAEKNIQY